MSDDQYLRTLDALRARNYKVTENGGGTAGAQCPAHDDRNASLSVSRGARQPVVMTCHAGCSPQDVVAALDLSWGDVCAPRVNPDGPDTWMPCGHEKVAEYRYRDARGKLVFAVTRCAMKGNGCQGFRQWRPDPSSKSGKRWSRNLPDGSRVGEGLPYRLNDVLNSDALRNVWIVEGEKDADRLWAMGIPATCNAQGAGKWTPAHAEWLVGRDVMIVADNDRPGYQHAEKVANTLLGLARSIEVVKAAKGKDISDHLNAGLGISKLITIAHAKEQPQIGPNGEDVTA